MRQTYFSVYVCIVLKGLSFLCIYWVIRFTEQDYKRFEPNSIMNEHREKGFSSFSDGREHLPVSIRAGELPSRFDAGSPWHPFGWELEKHDAIELITHHTKPKMSSSPTHSFWASKSSHWIRSCREHELPTSSIMWSPQIFSFLVLDWVFWIRKPKVRVIWGFLSEYFFLILSIWTFFKFAFDISMV